MIIKFLSAEVLAEQADRRQILIGKLWDSPDAYNFLNGYIGAKKTGQPWNFSEVSLHPGDKIFIKVNKYHNTLKAPKFLIYVENRLNASRLDKEA